MPGSFKIATMLKRIILSANFILLFSIALLLILDSSNWLPFACILLGTVAYCLKPIPLRIRQIVFTTIVITGLLCTATNIKIDHDLQVYGPNFGHRNLFMLLFISPFAFFVIINAKKL